MINDEELRISNKSYINKDFATIYPEIIETFKKITNRFDPETSNESDPMIVLLKLLAFVADKNNYNIDKNTLENFMLSATQETSMRKLCDMMGYYMNYYVAPEVDVTVMYTGDMSGTSIDLAPLVTRFGSKDETLNVEFILKEPISLQAQNQAVTKPALQGQLKSLLVNTSGTITSSAAENSLIQLDNLDDNNRLYFPESNVAQNGVFVESSKAKYEYWKVTTNLNYEEPLTKCFKFGYDSTRELPYIEFPKDIANIIEDGVRVYYIVTDGFSGNIKANVLNVLIGYDSNVFEGLDVENVYVRNNSGSINGANPETIDEAYNNFKKTVGTFETLVTCRDYANAFYSLIDSSGLPYMSNIQVSDRRDDFNFANKIVSYDNLGESVVNATTDLTAYDLCCYPLQPLTEYSVDNYKNSFKPISLTSAMKNAIESYKTISHDYKKIESNDLYAIINKLGLDAKLSTKYKVNNSERLEIVSNVVKALIRDFNARKVDYGYEIPYDSILNTIEKADERINFVSLAEPTLNTYFMYGNGNDKELNSSDALSNKVDYVAKNVLNGRVSLFDYDTRFNYDLGQQSVRNVYEGISQIDTNLRLVFGTDSSTNSNTLKKNEVIQLVAPNLITTLTYPSYCYFYLKSSIHDYENPIKAGTNYELKSGEELTCIHHDNDLDKDVATVYIEGQVIQPMGFDLFSFTQTMTSSEIYEETGRSVTLKTIEGQPTQKYFYLGAKESIKIKKVNATMIEDKTYCYWILNNAENAIDWGNLITIDDDSYYEYMLKDGEYFFYTDVSKTQLISLGSGTTLQLRGNMSTQSEDWTARVVRIEDVLDKGMLALNNYWIEKTFTSSNTLKFVENSILTLTEGDSLQIENLESSLVMVSSSFTTIPSSAKITYTIDGTSTPLDSNDIVVANWKAITRLDINATKDEPQVIYNPTNASTIDTAREFITIHYGNSDSESFYTNNQNIAFSSIVQLVGPTNQFSSVGGIYPLDCYAYVEDETQLVRSFDGYTTYSVSDLVDIGYMSIPLVDTKDGIMMVYFDRTSDAGTIKLSLENTNQYKIKRYNTNTYESSGKEVTIGTNGDEICIVTFENQDASGTLPRIKVEVNEGTPTGTITFGTFDIINGYNSELGLTSSEITSSTNGLLKRLSTLDSNNVFYYNNKIKNSNIIESTNILLPEAFYDANNVFNKFVISQIDFDNTSIDVVRSSRL